MLLLFVFCYCVVGIFLLMEASSPMSYAAVHTFRRFHSYPTRRSTCLSTTYSTRMKGMQRLERLLWTYSTKHSLSQTTGCLAFCSTLAVVAHVVAAAICFWWLVFSRVLSGFVDTWSSIHVESRDVQTFVTTEAPVWGFTLHLPIGRR